MNKKWWAKDLSWYISFIGYINLIQIAPQISFNVSLEATSVIMITQTYFNWYNFKFNSKCNAVCVSHCHKINQDRTESRVFGKRNMRLFWVGIFHQLCMRSYYSQDAQLSVNFQSSIIILSCFQIFIDFITTTSIYSFALTRFIATTKADTH